MLCMCFSADSYVNKIVHIFLIAINKTLIETIIIIIYDLLAKQISRKFATTMMAHANVWIISALVNHHMMESQAKKNGVENHHIHIVAIVVC